jgi:hypothetical protein
MDTATTITSELTKERVDAAMSVILRTLGEPVTPAQIDALKAFNAQDGALIKRLSVSNLSDNYLKCLGYLVSAPKLTPNTDTILAESARSAAEHVKDKALQVLSEALGDALNAS